MPKKQQSSFFVELRRRCNQLRTHWEKFCPGRRAPRREKLIAWAKILAAHVDVADLESRRCGVPRIDGSFYGLSEAQIAIRTGLGNPRKRYKGHNNWEGRRKISQRIRELREMRLLDWPAKWKLGGKRPATNPRHKIEKGPKKGQWRLYPAVRQVGEKFIALVQLDKHRAAAIEALRAKRAAGELAPLVDRKRARARWREVKFRQRQKAREVRVYRLDQDRAVAAKRTTERRQK